MSETIADLFQIEGRYLRSVNLERDFGDPAALNGYVLTAQVQSHLERMAGGLALSSSQRAWRVTGDYGVGKSSYALVMSRLFANERKHLPKNLRDAVNFKSLGAPRPQLLPILLTGSKEPLSVALLSCLSARLQGLFATGRPPAILAKVQAALKSTANGLTDETVIALLTETCTYLCNNDRASGLLIIIDELGKSLEYAALNPDRQDVFLLQRLAETAARSGKTPMFLVGLLHQGFTAYADTLSPSAQKEWEKVAGRFEEITFSQPLDQTLTLVANALCINVTHLPKARVLQMRSDLDETLKLRWYGAAYDRQWMLDNAAGIYPLHPTVLPALVSFFKRFGQNERSLFGFLLQQEPFGLQEFAQRPSTPNNFYRICNLYDYVRANFSYRLSVQGYRNHWNLIDSIVSSYPANDVLEEQILKTVGLLNLLDEQSLLASEEAVRLAVIGGDKSKIKAYDKALRALRGERHIIYSRGISGGWCLWPYTSVNLEKRYEEAGRVVEQQRGHISIGVAGYLENRPLVARRHYIETGNLRHFEVKYISVAALNEAAQLNYDSADGLIIVALCETEKERRTALSFAVSEQIKNSPAVLVAIPRPLNTLAALLHEAQRWEWVEKNTPELQSDRHAHQEVSRQMKYARQKLNETVASYVGLHRFSGKTELRWFRQGQEFTVGSNRELLGRLSELCDELYPQAPRIMNELVNRRSLSSAAAAARMRLLERIFSHQGEPLLGMDASKKPPEMSMYLSVLKAGNLHRQAGAKWVLAEPEVTEDPLNLLPAFHHIRALLERRKDSRVKLVDVLSQLRTPPFGIRDGIGVLLLAAFAVIHEPHVAFYENGVFKHKTAGLDVMHLFKVPEKYEIQYYQIAGVRAALFEEILQLLELPGRNDPQLLDVVRPLCVFAAKLPRYVHRTSQLSDIARRVRDALLNTSDPAKLLFEELPHACNFSRFEVNDQHNEQQVRKFVGTLKGAIDELRQAYSDLLRRVRTALSFAFDLSSEANEFRQSLASRADELAGGVSEPSLKSFCLRLRDAELPVTEWLESVGSLLSGNPPSKWTDADEGRFNLELSALASRFKRVESLNFDASSKRKGVQAAVRVAITKPDGVELNQVVYLNQNEEMVVAELEKQLTGIINRDDKAGLVAAARAFWKTLERQ
ncbi:MAG TPA: hypothetical protein PLD20_18230 [Blastocatellia bacterium]|nr:hypothetical protein [Blastocatellia bacterium]HMZ19880.1 hypothetical protein [Blastocatellia bacterium]